jgi:16S rRNA (uracil1498-N3)-methyltransferase
VGSLRESITNFTGSKVALFVGPEGGFSDDEIETAKKSGCRVVSLGERILRMETAALVFPAVVLYELGEL